MLALGSFDHELSEPRREKRKGGQDQRGRRAEEEEEQLLGKVRKSYKIMFLHFKAP